MPYNGQPTRAELVDDAMDAIMFADPRTTFVSAELIAHFMPGPVAWHVYQASNALQAHRKAQGRGATRWIISCQTYGPSSLWVVCGREGASRAGDRDRALGHLEHVMVDAHNRVSSDVWNEVLPAAERHPLVEDAITLAAESMAAAALAGVQQVKRAIALVEKRHATVHADTRNVAALDTIEFVHANGAVPAGTN
jgi:hypothetical protein